MPDGRRGYIFDGDAAIETLVQRFETLNVDTRTELNAVIDAAVDSACAGVAAGQRAALKSILKALALPYRMPSET